MNELRDHKVRRGGVQTEDHTSIYHLDGVRPATEILVYRVDHLFHCSSSGRSTFESSGCLYVWVSVLHLESLR